MAEVQELCERLIGNNEHVIAFVWPIEMNDDETVLLCEALAQNTAIQTIIFEGGPATLTSRAGSHLNHVLQVHPTVTGLIFYGMTIEEFGHAWFAVAMNNSLTCLSFTECRLSERTIYGLCLLLDSNAITSLTLRSCTAPDGQEAVLSASLQRNTSLKTIDYVGQYDEAEHDESFPPLRIAREVPAMLRNNRHLQDVELDLGSDPTVSRQVALETFEAAERHESLRRLEIVDENENERDHALGAHIGRALSSLLRNAPCLAELDLDCYTMAAETANGLAEGLSHNTVLRKLSLDSNIISGGISRIAEALHSHNSLRELTVHCQTNDVDGVASIAHMLTVNTTMEKVFLGHLDDRGMQVFLTMIPDMKALKRFEFSKPHGMDMYSRETETVLLRALEKNKTLVHVSMHYPRDCLTEETKSRVKYLTDLNRGGRKVIGSAHEVPRSAWPLILAKSSEKPDVLYFFLREKPDVLISQSRHCPRHSRKRKRE